MGSKREPTPQRMREEVFRRDKYTCRYCGTKEGPFHADHVYPYSKGGETTVDNLVTACPSCNGKKQAKIGIWPKPIIKKIAYTKKKRITLGALVVWCGIFFIPTISGLLAVYTDIGLVWAFSIPIIVVCLGAAIMLYEQIRYGLADE